MKETLESIRLSFSHGLILGNSVESEEYKPVFNDIQKFGLFDASAPNYVSFSPGTSKEDFTPKDEDFIYPTFRLLSETMVNSYSGLIDFSEPGVLKAAMALFQNQTVYPDHEAFVGNALGSVQEVFWQEAYSENGINVPAGINAKLKIDAVANPRIARLLLMKPPGIHSSSTTVNFKWKKSHDMTDAKFYDRMGEVAEDGQVIRKVATQLIRVFEQSLVSNGADPFAKISSGENLSDKTTGAKFSNVSHFDYSTMESIQSFNNNNFMNKPELPANFTAIMEALPNITLEEIQGFMARPEAIDETLITELAAYKALGAIEQLTAEVSLGKTFLSNVREETIKNYKLSVGPDNADEVILQTLENAPLTQLEAFNKSYKLQVDEKVPLTCASCGSTEVSRASYVPKTVKEGLMDAEAKIRKNRRTAPSSIHKGKV